MSNVVTLASIREATEAKYGSTIVDLGKDKVELVNALRLGKTKREKLTELQKDEEIEVHEKLSQLVRLVAKTEAQAEKLLAAVGEDTAVLAEIVNTYTKGTQAGEASPSES